MDLELTLRILIFRLRNRWNWALLKAGAVLIKIILWRMKLDTAMLTGLKRLAQRIEAERWNRQVEDSPTNSDGAVECVMCGETFTEDELTELREMGEKYHQEKGCFLCPDCWDSFQRMDPEKQAKVALVNGWKEAQNETDL